MTVSDLLFLEIFARSARLSKTAKDFGFQVLPIDKTAGRATQIFIAQYDLAGPDFFFLWFGRKCTRLGPYNCVSSENLRNKDTYGRWKWQICSQTNKHKKDQPTKRPANPARFAFRRKSNSKTTQERGKAQPQQPLDLPSDSVPHQQYHFQKHAKLISNCGKSSILLHADGFTTSEGLHMFFFVGARCLSAGRTWDSQVDEHGFEPPLNRQLVNLSLCGALTLILSLLPSPTIDLPTLQNSCSVDDGTWRLSLSPTNWAIGSPTGKGCTRGATCNQHSFLRKDAKQVNLPGIDCFEFSRDRVLTVHGSYFRMGHAKES